MYCRTERHTGHIDSSIGVFHCTVVECQRNFNILHVVLRQGEHAIFHICTLRTAAEVHHLEILINSSAVICGHAARTGDITVGVQRAAFIDGNTAVAFHFDKADGPTGRTAHHLTSVSAIMLGGKAHRTVQNQISAYCHCQSSKFCWDYRRTIAKTHTFRLSSIHSIGGVKGDEKGYACRNRIGTCGQRSAVHQNDCFKGRRRGIRCSSIQIVKQITRSYRIVINLIHSQKAG